MLKLDLTAGAQLGLELRPSEAKACLLDCGSGPHAHPWEVSEVAAGPGEIRVIHRPRPRPPADTKKQTQTQDSSPVALGDVGGNLHCAASAPAGLPAAWCCPQRCRLHFPLKMLAFPLPEKPTAFCSRTASISEGHGAQGRSHIWICSLI